MKTERDNYNHGPHVVCTKHGTCVLECIAACNTKKLVDPKETPEQAMERNRKAKLKP